jgi:hypothetical protein
MEFGSEYPNSFNYTFKVDDNGIHLISAQRRTFNTEFKKQIKLSYVIENRILKVKSYSATGTTPPFPKQYRAVSLDDNIARCNYRSDGKSQRAPLEDFIK